MLLKLTEQEKLTGVPEQETIEVAIEQIRKNGYIGFESVLSKEQVQEIKDAFLPIFNEYIDRFGYNTGTNRAQMHLPFLQPFVNDYMVANAFAMPVINAVLGEGVRCTYLASDTACPGSDYQNVHSDVPPLFPTLGVALPAYSLVMNIPLVDVHEENGPLEVWPGGTHLDPESTKHTSIDGEMLRAAKSMYSEKVYMPAGSVVIRDIRMWHRGTPNRTQENRTNIALIYNNDWYGAGGSIHVPQEAYDQASPAVKSLFRHERVGASVKMPWQW
ncbi:MULTISPECIES: phytanoyl-CoA dioxygenase family protein [Paenibacillus]|uniref:Phytanoyl-CoA dioxygenase family protein n=1 Tax=Paenibacillus lignilyticus TaxID=1172615 RepID=A0ABS5CHJ8_9BACL|nr:MULTISPECIES: phytanoyl-CoA dioxygenase family protein [Paenibacillus]MBP3965320.1 phytanoyl-CoA dioxygenase family protein [Paenibacillus lignilyticus]SDX34632.1 Phytanoyl-CoA dioxygenase (PhyH) [Paenibacillus sp. CF384]